MIPKVIKNRCSQLKYLNQKNLILEKNQNTFYNQTFLKNLKFKILK